MDSSSDEFSFFRSSSFSAQLYIIHDQPNMTNMTVKILEDVQLTDFLILLKKEQINENN